MTEPKTGYEEAAEWLRENAGGWRLRRAETTLVPGLTIGAPTQLQVEVELVPTSPERDVSLAGQGNSILSATKNAVGGLVVDRDVP